jgi:uncharacterized protein YgbK (DUF1537 family)
VSELLLTYYGDDFTGSTAALEELALGGVPAALFLESPTPEQVAARFPGIKAVGVAGTSRSMTTAEMEEALPPIFESLKRLGAALCHYKVCSTFDSSPAVGSIGRALDIGWRIFNPDFVPVVVGAPGFKRYVLFGNLFATVGDETFRLDRHPTMRHHPVTPMDESDLRLHLARQTARSIALVDVLQLAGSDAALEARLEELRMAGNEVILFDTLDKSHLLKIGRLTWEQARQNPLFAVGSQGLETALAGWWREQGLVQAAPSFEAPGHAEKIIVMSGSASPATAAQIAWAEANGFKSIRLDVPRLLDPQTARQESEEMTRQGVEALAAGASPLFYSARGPGDPALASQNSGGPGQTDPGRKLGIAQGGLLRNLLEKTAVRRICVAGGDTSSYVVQQLGLFAMTVVCPLSPGAPLCRAYSRADPRLDGLELSLKGGQVGAPDFFGRVKRGQ